MQNGKPLLFAETIAGAVARAIHAGWPDGIAYKAAWDRKGSDCANHILAAQRDAYTMQLRVYRRGAVASYCAAEQ